MHLDDEQIQRLLHAELAPTDEAPLREHLETCPGCRRRVAGAEREEEEVYALLRRLDHAPPQLGPDAMDAIVEQARGDRLGWGRWAAGILLALGAAGAAYALPGSPLPGWVDRVASWMGAGRPGQAPEPASGVAGIAVEPGQALVILLPSPGPGGQARVRLTDGDDVVVRTLNGTASFSSDPDRLVIDDRGAPLRVEIGIPRQAPRVEIRVGDRPVFLKDGPRITTRASPDERGSYLLPLGGTGS